MAGSVAVTARWNFGPGRTPYCRSTAGERAADHGNVLGIQENPELEIDLPSQEIRRPNGVVIKFEIDPFRKKCLLEGLDDIGLTLQKVNERSFLDFCKS